MNSDWTKYLPDFLFARLDGRHSLQRVISNTGWLFADRVFRTVVGLLVVVWIARYLGPEQFGVYNYAIAFVSLFGSLASLGLDGIVVRNITRNPEAVDEVIGTAFVLKLAGGVATLLSTVALIAVFHSGETLTLWLVGVIAAGAIFQSFDTIDFWFQARVKSKYTVYAKGLAFTVISLVKIALIVAQAPLIAFAWAGLAEIALGALCLVTAYQLKGERLSKWRWSGGQARVLLSDSWPLILSGVAIYIQARIDQVMLGEMIGNAEVGQYSVAMRLIEAFAFIPVIIQSSVAPTVTRAKMMGEELYRQVLLNIYRLMFGLFLVTAIPIFLFSEAIVQVLFGDEYRYSAALLSLFSVRIFFTNMGVARSLFITNENLFRYAFYTALLGSLVNVGLNYILIPTYASIGAIWATIASFFVTTFLIDLLFDKPRANLVLMIAAILTPWKLKTRPNAIPPV